MIRFTCRSFSHSDILNCRHFTNKALYVTNRQYGQDHGNVEPINMAYSSYDAEVIEGLSPLIIMHGLFGSKKNWNSLAKALNKKTKRKVITLDARNHGDSPHTDEFSYFHLKEDVNELANKLDLPPSCYMGHSMGGRAMMLFALEYPEKIEKLIVVDISPVNSSISIHFMGKFFKALKDIDLDSSLSSSEGRAEANTQLSNTIRDPDVRQFLLTNLIKTDSGFKWKLNLDSLSNAFQHNILKFPEVEQQICDKPTLFIGGNRSDYLRPSDHDYILTLFPQAKFVYINAGHWLHAEQPQEFTDFVRDFIENE